MKRALALLAVAACADGARSHAIVFVAAPPRAEAVQPETPWQAPASRPPATCGEARLRKAELVALGKGEKHPEVLVVNAKLAACGDAMPTAVECADVAREAAELVADGYGPRHPTRVASDAKMAVCASATPRHDAP